MPVVSGLKPEPLWQYFEQLTQIPRPSKHEGRVLQWLKDFAQARGLKWQQDAVGNLVIKRPGSGGGEAAPVVVIQGHVDMVTEKNADTVFDFYTDGLRLTRDDTWLKAVGTTLGADNGIGVCAALALLSMQPSAKLPPLECLFTVDEETGLTGAFELDASMLSGRTLLNLDTEDWGEIFIGCAGGGDSEIILPIDEEPAPVDLVAQEVAVTGLMGGHSGLNINEDRGNAVIIAALVADAVLQAVPLARLASIRGGDKRNAIPRECKAILLVPEASAEKVFAEVVANQVNAIQAEYGTLEKDLSIASLPVKAPTNVLTPESAHSLLTLLLTLPHGVHKYSHAVPGLVETSTNLAAVGPASSGDHHRGSALKITCSTRSSLMPALDTQRKRIAKLSSLCGAEVAQDKAYPGWAPNPKSDVLQITKDVFHELLGVAPKVGAIHAGLECGILGDKIPGIDMVSYGPTIRGAHSPDEKVEIATVEKFWDATLLILQRLADKRA
ncbi:hypothetical protein WJX72_012284 [[Myrmecia] bisecta]|uniref:Peptidase M20 dimerisation domain-containing protein n=1 Tax=[Myrmecia] bisecta TaxID=41462 RepID=A0AAW1RA25_9CHLO